MTDVWDRAPEGAEYYSANSSTYYKIDKGSVQVWGDESIDMILVLMKRVCC